MPLFNWGDFVLHSGGKSQFKINCDALTKEDWEAVAQWACKYRLPKFGEVEGVPQGGLAFAEALSLYVVPGYPLLIADDVLTTGRSMQEQRGNRPAIGVALFARGHCPEWVIPLCRWF